MEKHFVTFFSPGTFVPEESTKEIGAWSVTQAADMARVIKERYGAIPFGFRFSTRSRGENDLDSKTMATSPMYYLGGTVLTIEDIEKRADPKDEILLWNMRCNRVKRVIQNDNSWRFTCKLDDDDVVLEWPA